MSEPDTLARIGRRIGPYRLTALLGRGASGEVYLAERVEAFQQRIAIKLFDPTDLAASAFVNETNRLEALDHPAIVKFIDRGEVGDGLHYLAMEYVEGLPVDVYCADPRCGWRERLAVLVRIAEALAAAHRHMVIHADLKPANILVSRGGDLRVLDFGGGYTPLFASPEQLDQQPLTAASDVYSLGVLARFVSAGCLVGSEALPSATRAAGFGSEKDLAAVLDKATRRISDERYASMDLFAEDLRRVLDRREVSARPPSLAGQALRWSLRHRFRSATIAVVALVALTAAGNVVVNALRAAQARAVAEAQLQRLMALSGELQGELYESTARLPQSQMARAMLLDGARRTLATLTAEQQDDPTLALELAHQYIRLVELDAAEERASGAATTRLLLASDADHARSLLDRNARQDAQRRALRLELARATGPDQ